MEKHNVDEFLGEKVPHSFCVIYNFTIAITGIHFAIFKV